MSDCHSQVWTSTVLWNSKVSDVYKQHIYGFLHCNFSQKENVAFFSADKDVSANTELFANLLIQ